MGRVGIVKTGGEMKDDLAKLLNLIGGVDQYISRGDVVLLKPNLNGVECTTNIYLVEALIQLLFEYGTKSVFIGESSFGNSQTTDRFFSETGYRDLAERYGIRLINFNKSETIEIPVENSYLLERVRVAKEFFEADKVINLPVMKVHYATGVTLSLKNLKGLMPPAEKRKFHEIGLDMAISDLNSAVKADLNIVDATYCMERMGPHGGDVIKLGLLFAGEENWEVDCIGSRVMGYSVEEVKHLKYYMDKNGIGDELLRNIEVLGEKIEDVQYSFKKAVVDGIVPEGIHIHNVNACSTCENAFLLSCKFLEHKINSPVHVYMGSVHDAGKCSDGINIGFGNCCNSREMDKRIKGCPPYPFELKNVLSQRD